MTKARTVRTFTALVTAGLVVAGVLNAVLHAAGASVGVIQAPGSPVTLEPVKLLNTDGTPMVLLYGARNTGTTDLDQFTVTVLVFDQHRQLKARQVAPGRRSLKASETKFSAMVLDVGGIEAGDSLLVGVDQAQQVGSEDWWRADLRTLAEAKMKAPPAK
jgi:hypothetical protein